MKVDVPHFGTKREGHEGPRHGNKAGLLAQAGHGAIWGSALKHDPLIMSSFQAMGSRPLGAVLCRWICLALWKCSSLGQLIIQQLGLAVFFTSLLLLCLVMGFPGDTSGKEPTCQCRRCKRTEFHPWVGKIPWRRAWQPTPVFLTGESHGQRSLAGYSP